MAHSRGLSLSHLSLDSKCACGNNVAVRKSTKGHMMVQSEMCRSCMAYKQRYGLTVTERDRLLEDQGGVCKCCKNPVEFSGLSSPRNTRAVVDHCHKGGHVRGVLCGACNIALGNVEDNVDTLHNMILYLKGELNG